MKGVKEGTIGLALVLCAAVSDYRVEHGADLTREACYLLLQVMLLLLCITLIILSLSLSFDELELSSFLDHGHYRGNQVLTLKVDKLVPAD